MEDLKKDLTDDLKEKIKFLDEHPNKIESYLFPDEKNDKKAMEMAKQAVDRANKQNEEEKIYFLSMIEKVKQLKQNPSTTEEKKLWLEVVGELKSDFGFHHDSRNMNLGWAGEILLGYIFDIKNK